MFGLSVEQQLLIFIYFNVIGLLTGLVFDFFKAFANVFRFSRRIIFLLDLFLCLLAAFIVYYELYLLNYGEARLFVFLALLIGLLFYYLVFSRFISRNLLEIFRTFKLFFCKIQKFFYTVQDFARRIKNYLYQRLLSSKDFKGKQ
ncbi:MAG TPA: hypothetical protein GX004_08760 [Firmicutes bacterium]|jgi:spore cortex biosynthesis protein YabQ|nr:hypothetical protein [Bacillota bacterium]